MLHKKLPQKMENILLLTIWHIKLYLLRYGKNSLVLLLLTLLPTDEVTVLVVYVFGLLQC